MSKSRVGGRVVDCARLESVCAARHQGFESPPTRQLCRLRTLSWFVRQCVTQVAEIRTRFDRRGELLAGNRSEAPNPEPKRELRQSPPTRQRHNPLIISQLVRQCDTDVAEIQTPFDRRGALRAGNKSEAQNPAPTRSVRQSPPTRHWFGRLLLLSAVIAIATGCGSSVSSNDIDGAAREYQRENFKAAIAILDRLEKNTPPTVESLDLRGRIYLEQQQFEEARKLFEAAHKANPQIFAPRLHLGDVLLLEKKYADARAAYQQLLRETNILVSNERLRFAVMLTYLGEHDEAAARQALEVIKFPTESACYYYAQAGWAFAHNKKSEAEDWIGRAQSVYPVEATSWYGRHLYHFGWLKKKPPLSKTF